MHFHYSVMQPNYSASPCRTRRHANRKSLMKTDPARLARLLETTRRFWGLGIAPLSGENNGAHVDACQLDEQFSEHHRVDAQFIVA